MHRPLLLTAGFAAFFVASAAAQTEGDIEYPPGFEDPMPLHDRTSGLGTFHREITTSSPEAQAYFDQGIQLLYAFTPPDAARSFREAEKKDPQCAMCYFGEAWSWGSYLNGPMTADDNPRAYAAIQKARSLEDGHTTPVERALIEAMTVRYEPTWDASHRRSLDEAYAKAMNAVYKEFPHDLDAGTLAGESLMLLQPRRGYWDIDNPEVQEIHRVLESVLAQDIRHPGACHLYVHATEPTTRPDKAEACAEYLGTSIPGASHIEHMPSHTWNRVGRWGDAVRANILAWHADLAAAHGDGFAIYPSHNVQMLLFAASNDGQGAVAYEASEEYARLMDGDTSYEMLTLFRFGKFQKMIDLDTPPKSAISMGFWNFGKGYASLRLGDEGTARWYLHLVQQAAQETPERQNFRGHTPAELLGVVGAILDGEIHRADGDVDGAIEILKEGLEIEDGLGYDEPEPLNFSIRQWLGDALHEAGRHAEAADVFRAELDDHPHNGWSLFGLERELREQGKNAEADEVHAEFEQAWARSDTYLRGPIF